MAAVNVFVARAGNEFMVDIASVLIEAAQLTGRTATLVDDGSLPVDAAAINLVIAPHEFYVLNDADDRAIHAAAAISVPVCTEQPGTKWFEMSTLVSAASTLVLDINQHGVEALRSQGLAAEHLRIGGTPSMDGRTAGRSDHRPTDRPIDALFLGGLTDHRAEQLAHLGPLLWEKSADLRLFTFNRPVDGAVAGLVFGRQKYELLARSRLLINLHRDGQSAGYFEWARLVEAMANGCVVVTEPVSGYEPLVPGEHFVVTDDVAATVAELLADPGRCDAIGAAAAAAVHDTWPMVASLEPILDRVERRIELATPQRAGRLDVPRYRSRLQRAKQVPLLPAFAPTTDLRRRVYEAVHAEMELRRTIDGVRCMLHHGVNDHVERVESPAFRSAQPDVSVLVTLFDYEHVVEETLDSIVGSTDVSFEIVVVDDHSTDDGRNGVRRYIERHADVPILLLGSDINRGLPASRNLAIEHCRADHVMVMDADNLLYPTCLRRLSDALDVDPAASFAYSILEEFGSTTGLRSAIGWHVPWLCEANHIDAQAMVRRQVFEHHGGYRTGDPLVFGWEDWELWLRLAAAGSHGVHVAQILGRYRTQATSMLSTSNLFSDLMLEHVRSMYPSLPWQP